VASRSINDLQARADDAERRLLGGIFIRNAAYDQVSEMLKAEHFGDERNGAIYAACGVLIHAGQVALPITVKAYLERCGVLQDVGGPSYLAELANAVITHMDFFDPDFLAWTILERWAGDEE
jgi:replicative DNA helicase